MGPHVLVARIPPLAPCRPYPVASKTTCGPSDYMKSYEALMKLYEAYMKLCKADLMCHEVGI